MVKSTAVELSIKYLKPCTYKRSEPYVRKGG